MKRAISGESLQTQKAIALTGIFIGEEAARLTLKEETRTSQYAKQLVTEFESLDKKERVKGLAKLALSLVTGKYVQTRYSLRSTTKAQSAAVAAKDAKTFVPQYAQSTQPAKALKSATTGNPSPSTRTAKQSTAPLKHPGPYAPNRKLPEKNGVGIPDPEAQGRPHTQLGTVTRENKGYSYTKAREFGTNGKAVKDIEFTNHNRKDHANPHQHQWVPNKTGGTLKRGNPEPLNTLPMSDIQVTQQPSSGSRPKKPKL